MSSLTDVEKRYLEKILQMQGGYVLDYTDAKFAGLFNRLGIDIHSPKYQTHGTSKAKKMRAFWDKEPDDLVARVLSEMLDSYEAYCNLNGIKIDRKTLQKCKEIVARLSGGKAPVQAWETDESFLSRQVDIPDLDKLPIDSELVGIIEARLEEAKKTLAAGAHLAAIILCGSVLEGVLLGAAQRYPEKFNRSSKAPKGAESKVKPLHDWSLAQFIDVAHDIGILGLDVKKFSHALRDFRNFIHPQEQMKSGFTPDEHTAKICMQVLKAALAHLAEDR